MTLEERFKLPPKQTFPVAAPRYPNVWFFIDQGLAVRYEEAVSFLIDWLRTNTGLVDDFERSNPEGSDGKARVQGLQPYDGFEAEEFNHYHDLHIRHYWSPLMANGLGTISLEDRAYHRVASSVHYEVAQKHRYHPYIDPCPVCGVTGDYDIRGDRCEKIHDPLGLELLLFGTIRGNAAMNDKGTTFRSLSEVRTHDLSIEHGEPKRSDINTLRLGCVRLAPFA